MIIDKRTIATLTMEESKSLNKTIETLIELRDSMNEYLIDGQTGEVIERDDIHNALKILHNINDIFYNSFAEIK